MINIEQFDLPLNYSYIPEAYNKLIKQINEFIEQNDIKRKDILNIVFRNSCTACLIYFSK